MAQLTAEEYRAQLSESYDEPQGEPRSLSAEEYRQQLSAREDQFAGEEEEPVEREVGDSLSADEYRSQLDQSRKANALRENVEEYDLRR